MPKKPNPTALIQVRVDKRIAKLTRMFAIEADSNLTQYVTKLMLDDVARKERNAARRKTKENE